MAVERAPQVRRFASPTNGTKRGVRLEWEGKKTEIDVPVLPFQIIETINEPRQQLTLFSAPDDARPGFPPGWKNKLIWGDNKLAMAALAEQYAGQVNLVYIDPPFNTDADFSVQVALDGEQIVKEPGIIERHAYQDTWGRGLDSYLQWFYETLLLLRTMLSAKGSIYIHCDWHVGHYMKLVLDDVFGIDNFQNQVIWQRFNFHADANRYGIVSDEILFYSLGNDMIWNPQMVPIKQSYVDSHFRSQDSDGRQFKMADILAKGPGPARRFGDRTLEPPSGTHWRFGQEKIDELMAQNRIAFTKQGTPAVKMYLDEKEGAVVHNIWTDIAPVNPMAVERTDYPTQKPEALLDRIIKSSSNPGDLVFDCFVGSGTTASVAERLGRRWIACDLGRFAIHTTRKRLLGWCGENNERCRGFEILNLGHYERQFWQGADGEETDDGTAKRRERDYLRTMLAFYHVHPLDGADRIHGEKSGRAVHVGPLAESVSRMEAFEASEAALTLGFRGLDILGWEWDFESNETVKEDAKMRGVDLRLVQIPVEMLDSRARKLFQDGKLTFPELASLKVKIESLPGQRRAYHVHLEDFIIPPGTLPEALRDRVTRWQDYIDYWSVDWEFGKETLPGERDTFHNMWQDFRTKKKRALALTSEPHDYATPGAYTVVVKVVDIFGNDTTVSRRVDVP